MNLINFVRKEYQTKTVSEILINRNTDGKEGLSWQEVHKLIEDGHNKKSWIFYTAKFLWGTKSMTNSVFEAFDKNNDKIITLKECDDFAQKECKHTLKELWNMTVADICTMLDNTPPKK